jgi:YVTN family beta-propeller protein
MARVHAGRPCSTGPGASDIYVIKDEGTVSVIDSATHSVPATVTVRDYPQGVSAKSTGPDAGGIYVANRGGGTVSVINPATCCRMSLIKGVG